METSRLHPQNAEPCSTILSATCDLTPPFDRGEAESITATLPGNTGWSERPIIRMQIIWKPPNVAMTPREIEPERVSPPPNRSSSPTVAPQTLMCMSVIPSAACVSSRSSGWGSLLLDVHSGISSHDPYDSICTTDPRIGVTISGRFAAELHAGGRWRHDVHGPGSINVHRTGEQTRYRFPRPKDADFKLALIYYPLAQLEAAAEHLRQPGQPARVPSFNSRVGRDPALTQMTFALIDALDRGVGDIYAETVSAWLAVHMLTRHANMTSTEDRSPGEITDGRLARVMEFMSTNFAEHITLERLAAEACVSKFHFSRLFTTKVGETPYRCLMGIRLDAASRMLVATDLPVGQVAAACGFAALSNFSAAFRRRFGMSAGDYRRKLRNG